MIRFAHELQFCESASRSHERCFEASLATISHCNLSCGIEMGAAASQSSLCALGDGNLVTRVHKTRIERVATSRRLVVANWD